MKQLTVTGNLGHSATVQEINGRNYYKFSIAVAGSAKDAPTEWVDVLYPQFSESLGDLLRSGTKVLVVGKNTVRAYTDKEGRARAGESVWADKLEILKVNEPDDNAPADDDDLPFK